jgi:hypothetical protein
MALIRWCLHVLGLLFLIVIGTICALELAEW